MTPWLLLLRTVSDWVSGSDCQPVAAAAFLQVTDYWLVAHVLAHECTVVAHEVPADTVYKTATPNTCIGLGLRFMIPYNVLRVNGPDSSWGPLGRPCDGNFR